MGMSITVRLATGFDSFMPSHSLVPVTAPRLGRDIYNTIIFINNDLSQIGHKSVSKL